MFRIDDPSAAAALPTPEAAGTEGYWTEGNPGSNIAATLARASFLNMIQEELRAIVTAAGITPSKTTYNQVLTAIKALMKTQGLQASGLSVVTATGSLTVANAGGTVAINAAGATTQTLPAASALAAGMRIELMNTNAGIATVARAGTDSIRANGSTITSLALGAGDTLTLESDGVSSWYAVGGSAQLASAAAFGASLGTSGYQKLPSGLIIQWGQVAATNAGSAVTFPIAFPTAVRSIVISFIAGATFPVLKVSSGTVTGFTATTSLSESDNCYWFAVGN